MSKIRQQRTAEQIQVILSELMLREMNDPRLQELTITAVTIDRELQYADVYVHALGDETRQTAVLQALDKATGFFRHELAQRLRLRATPQLHFQWDATLAHIQEVNRILDNLVIPPPEAEDEEE